MVSVTMNDAPDNIGVLVAEAVQALGYFRPDAVEQLTQIYRDLWPRGTSAHMLSKADYQPLLSEKGLAQPGPASMNTTLRITGNVQRQRELDNEHIWGEYSSRVQFWCVAKNGCAPAIAMLGQIVPRKGRPSIPLPGCDREWCTCGWDQVRDD